MTHLGNRKVVWMVTFVLLALVVAALACGPMPATPMPTPTPTPATPMPTPTPTLTPTPERTAPEASKGASSKGTAGSAGLQPGGSRRVTLTLVNDLNETVCYVFISPPSEDTWGDDWLGSDGVISSGNQRAFSVEAGTWDVMAADCDGNELASEYAYAMNGDTTWTLSWSAVRAGGSAGGAAQPYTIVNNSAADICYVYISPTTSDSWGADWLGSSIIPVGTQYTFYVTPGSYDILLADCSGNTLDQQMDVYLSGGETWYFAGGSSGGGAQPYTIVNNSATDICYVYISPTTSSDWGSDWLGSDILYAGSSYTFYVTPGSYDILLADCSGNTLDQQMDVYLSGGETWYFAGAQPGGGATAGVTFVNQTSSQICYIWIGAPQSEWAGDALGSSILEAYSSLTVSIEPGTWALQAETCDGVVVYYHPGIQLYNGVTVYLSPD